VTHKGKFYTVENAGIGIKPLQAGGPPIWIAAKVEAALKRAARIGDAWLIVPSSMLTDLVPQMRFYREALRAFAKPEPSDFPLTRECFVGTSQATAMEECREALIFKYKAYASWGLYGNATEFSIDEFARDRFIIGDEDFVAEEIARYRETLGVNHFIMRMQWPGLPQERVLHSIRALGRIFARAKGEK
jgi:alkanesulfonate monooxygenase SsuD/methylene tetrahydromethanopterin reductase-like flavin-dependent oxidoreductase (luciferase family)